MSEDEPCLCETDFTCLAREHRIAMTLTEFLLARIAEDEAQVAYPPERDDQPQNDMRIQWSEVGAIREVLTIGEARLRAECEAKRLLLAHVASNWRLEESVGKILALPYADHPDYREEWKP